MSNANVSNTPVTDNFDGGGATVDVPSGEVWLATVIYQSNDYSYAKWNGNNFLYADNTGGGSTAKAPNIVLTGGDTISSTGNNDDGGIVTGWVINEGSTVDIENQVVQDNFDGGGATVDVPSGEVWKGTVTHQSNDPSYAKWNGNNFLYANNTGSGRTQVTNIVLTGGDTISTTGNDDDGGIFTGFRVDQ